MPLQLAVAIAIHQLATLVWVGGMFFAHFALRAAAQSLEPATRLPLLAGVMRRFFRWVWLAILALWASGAWIWFGIQGGHMGGHVHAMATLALVMTGLFVWLWFVPYARLRAAVKATDWAAAGAAFARVRLVIVVNLGLGLLTAVLGAAGRYL